MLIYSIKSKGSIQNKNNDITKISSNCIYSPPHSWGFSLQPTHIFAVIFVI